MSDSMKKSKKMITFALAVVLGLSAMTGCGRSDGGSDEKKIVVGATIKPHSEILHSDAFQSKLKELGYTIDVVEYTDYVQPNSATQDGSLDANFFQHKPFLDSYNEGNKADLVSVAQIHYEPFGLYPGTSASLETMKDGACIAVPNDTSNEARALLLLQEAGLITVDDKAGLKATIKDITSNPHKITFKEIESAQTSMVLDEVDYSVINGNYALQAGLSVEKDALVVEDASSEAADTYANILVVKSGNEETDKTKALVEALTSKEVSDYMNETYQGAIVPMF